MLKHSFCNSKCHRDFKYQVWLQREWPDQVGDGKREKEEQPLETLGNENIHEPKVLPCWLEEGKLQTAVNQEKKKETEI